MLTSFTSTSGRTFSQLPSSNSFSKALSFDLGVPTKYCPSLWRRIWRFSSLTIPRSNTHTRRAFPYFRSLTPRGAQPIDCQNRSHTRPPHIRSFVVEQPLQQFIQPQPLPKLQPDKTIAKLPRSLQANLLQPNTDYMGIVLGRVDLGREKTQLVAFTLFVENL